MKSYNTLIKICGVTDVDTAAALVRLNIDFIGLVFYEKSCRNITLDNAKKISSVVSHCQTKLVPVFVDYDAQAMLKVCTELNTNFIQLHGDVSRLEHKYLPADFKRLYAVGLNINGEIVQSDNHQVEYLKPERDYILFDSINPGGGQVVNYKKIRSYFSDFKFMIAGGLNTDNVYNQIIKFSPTGVDVSSGVEEKRSKKSIVMCEQFIYHIRKNQYR